MWFRTLAESAVGIKINHGVTLEGPVLGPYPGSVEGGVLILLSAVGKVVRIEEELRIFIKDLMKDSLESFYIFCTCCFTSFLTSFYLHLNSTRVDQHAKKSMFYETSTLPPCIAQEFAMLYDTLWHIQGRSCRQYRHTYIRHI